MRQITKDAVSAFYSGRDFKRSNTFVQTRDGTTRMWLFGNLIAMLNKDTGLRVRNAGWMTPTTKGRLNGVLYQVGYSIAQRDGRWILSDKVGTRWAWDLLEGNQGWVVIPVKEEGHEL